MRCYFLALSWKPCKLQKHQGSRDSHSELKGPRVLGEGASPTLHSIKTILGFNPCAWAVSDRNEPSFKGIIIVK